jgi:peptide/nickel transport system substrate-binding protein
MSTSRGKTEAGKRGRWLAAAAIVAAGALALSACGSSSAKTSGVKVAPNYSYGSIPAQSSSIVNGGTVNVAEQPGADPNWIFPITPAANSSVYVAFAFQDLSWRPLYFFPTGSNWTVDYPKSIASAAPAVSNGGKTFTIDLKSTWKWSNGTPVTSSDVLFDFDLLKAAVKESAANSGGYTPGQWPDNVTSMTAPTPTTLVVTFDKTYNPSWASQYEIAGFTQPLPSTQWNLDATGGAPVTDWNTNPADAKKIYDYLAAQSKSLSTYATNPLWQTVDGPYKISAYNTSTGADSFVANTAFTGGSSAHITTVNELAYTSTSAEFNDLLSGKLDEGGVDFTDLPQIKKLASKGYAYYGLPSMGFSYMYYNFKDTTDDWNNIVGQLYVRQAMAHLQDEQAEIKGAFDGAAAPAYGPVAVAPYSPYTPSDALNNPYPFSVADATSLLKSHGWSVVPGGKTTCTSPGTAANECGSGISAGQDISFVMYYSNSPAAIGTMITAWASELKKVGIQTTLKSDTFDNLINNQSVVSSPNLENTWGGSDFGGFSGSIYPTTDSIFNTGGSYNEGGFSNPAVDSAINGSISSSNPNALQTEISAVATQLPGNFQPVPDNIAAWKTTLSGPNSSFANLTQYYFTPEDWYFTK